MREQVVLVAVLAGAAAMGALLVMPGRHDLNLAPPDPTTEPSAPEAPQPDQPPPTAPPAPPPVPSHVHVDPRSAQVCAPGSVLVEGMYCPFVGHRCLEYADEGRDLCQRFAPEALCEGSLRRVRACVDVFEYPNLVGLRPAVYVSFEDARRACAMEGKRLCTAEEWELACEGTGMWPYPYGLERDPFACAHAPPGPDLHADRWEIAWSRASEASASELRSPSGSHPRCVGPFGVVDQVGNVEEWVDHKDGSETAKPFRSARKGGAAGRGKGRCRPLDATEPPWFRAPDLGFRCCADPTGAGEVERQQPVSPDIRGPVPKRRRTLVAP